MEGVVNSPVGLLVKSNVLVMDFLGKDMKNAPRLRDSNVTGVERWSEIYL
jgi:serine/threonine-protein kinase RIO1